ncbi:hypothetical protein [Chroococcidiopsis sp. SAG 2025]|nr:hypothetical protein [Chroococcidiopsis sp. SAG 2025]
MRDICRGVRLCASTDRLFYPIKNCYQNFLSSDRIPPWVNAIAFTLQ